MLARFFTGLHPLLFLSLATYQPKLDTLTEHSCRQTRYGTQYNITNFGGETIQLLLPKLQEDIQ